MRNRISILSLLVLIIGLMACSGSSTSSPIEIQDAWVRVVGAMDAPVEENSMGSGTMETNNDHTSTEGSTSGMIGSTGAVFMTIKNSGQDADKLVAAASDVADAVEIHLSEMKDDIMTMRQVDGVDIPAAGEAVLKPGSYHIMLIGMNQELAVGDKVSLTLTFENAGQMKIDAEVRAMP
jgi:periplasmic copper chaperone A